MRRKGWRFVDEPPPLRLFMVMGLSSGGDDTGQEVIGTVRE